MTIVEFEPTYKVSCDELVLERFVVDLLYDRTGNRLGIDVNSLQQGLQPASRGLNMGVEEGEDLGAGLQYTRHPGLLSPNMSNKMKAPPV